MEFDLDPDRVRNQRLSQIWRIEERMNEPDFGPSRRERIIERHIEREPSIGIPQEQSRNLDML